MTSIDWKMFIALGLAAGAGVVWVPKALESKAADPEVSVPEALPEMIDPATGLPIELPSEPGSAAESGPEPRPSEELSTSAPEPAPIGSVSSALNVGSLDPAALLELASSLRSERIARGGDEFRAAEDAEGTAAPAQRIAPKVEEVLSLYPLSATLRAAGRQLAIIAGEAVEIDQSFGPDGLVLREIGWDSVTVEYQGRRYPLRMPSFRSSPASTPAEQASALAPPQPTVP